MPFVCLGTDVQQTFVHGIHHLASLRESHGAVFGDSSIDVTWRAFLPDYSVDLVVQRTDGQYGVVIGAVAGDVCDTATHFLHSTTKEIRHLIKLKKSFSNS